MVARRAKLGKQHVHTYVGNSGTISHSGSFLERERAQVGGDVGENTRRAKFGRHRSNAFGQLLGTFPN